MFLYIPLTFRYLLSRTRYYLATGRELKRLDAMTRSPIFVSPHLPSFFPDVYSHASKQSSFSETLNGLSTIRAFGQQKIFILENHRRINRNQMCYLPAISVNRWLAIRLGL